MQDVLDDLITLTGYTENDTNILKKHTSLTAEWQEEVTQIFYDTLYGQHGSRRNAG